MSKYITVYILIYDSVCRTVQNIIWVYLYIIMRMQIANNKYTAR